MINFYSKTIYVQDFKYIDGVDFNLDEHRQEIESLVDPTIVNKLKGIKTIVEVESSIKTVASISKLNGEHFLVLSMKDLYTVKNMVEPFQFYGFFNGYLVHEAKHVEQIENGNLVIIDTEPGAVIWKGVKYSVKGIHEHGYKDQPWEAEAIQAEMEYLVEQGLFANLEEAYKKYYQGMEFLNKNCC
jgi:hypothetical protein